MFNSILLFLLKFKYIILFYLGIIIFLLIKKKQIEVQAKFIFLYRMKWGLKWMDKYAKKFREWIILLGYVGVGAGFVGLVVISVVLIKNLIDYFQADTIVTGASIVYPGMNVPGLGILPFWDWILAIFLIAVIHEFSHGIVARAHNIEVKNTGLVLFGPILGAFVEPNENKMRKESDIKQYSVLAAGSFSNVLLALFALVLLNFVFVPWNANMVEPTGFTFDSYVNDELPFAKAGIMPGTLITGINKEKTSSFQEFSEELNYNSPGEKIVIMTSQGEHEITLASNPDNVRKSFLGIKEIRNEVQTKANYQTGIPKLLFSIVSWGTGFLRWLFLLSFGIGLFNLLPLPIVDGGRMAQTFLHKLKGFELGEKRYRQVSLFFLVLLLLNLFYPLLSKLF
jgi:membrane-associated protease RseP (regulator of RpoE activity)